MEYIYVCVFTIKFLHLDHAQMDFKPLQNMLILTIQLYNTG